MRIKANGITFNYEIEGPEGASWIMFSNSLATNLSMWDPQVADFKPSFRMLRYDQRGHGGTDAPAGRYTYPTLVADALALLDALEHRAPHFVGLSMGGATALGARRASSPTGSITSSSATRPRMSTPASAQQWEERIAMAQKGGMEALVEFHPGALVPARNACGEARPCRQGARDDPHDAGQRLHRLFGRAGGPRLQHRGRHRDAAGAVHRRLQGRRHAGGDEGHARSDSTARATWSSKAPGTFPISTGRRSSPGRCGSSSGRSENLVYMGEDHSSQIEGLLRKGATLDDRSFDAVDARTPRPHPEEPCGARRLEGWPHSLRPVAVLRDARKRAPQDEVSKLRKRSKEAYFRSAPSSR